jgi:hypothetical protein
MTLKLGCRRQSSTNCCWLVSVSFGFSEMPKLAVLIQSETTKTNVLYVLFRIVPKLVSVVHIETSFEGHHRLEPNMTRKPSLPCSFNRSPTKYIIFGVSCDTIPLNSGGISAEIIFTEWEGWRQPHRPPNPELTNSGFRVSRSISISDYCSPLHY